MNKSVLIVKEGLKNSPNEFAESADSDDLD